MAYPDSTKPFILFTDASHCAVGSVLSQVQNGRERVIAYASHVLTAAERRWSTYDRELWAIVWSIRHFRHYLACSPFTIVTDHKPLVGLRKLPVHNDRTGRRSRWALELDPYDWLIIHRDGARHANADALSRRPTIPDEHDKHDACQITLPLPTTKPAPLAHTSSCATVQTPKSKASSPSVPHPYTIMQSQSHDTSVNGSVCFQLSDMGYDLNNAQQSDPDIQQVITWVTLCNRPSRAQLRNYSRTIRRLCLDFNNLLTIDGVLYRRSQPTFGKPRVNQVIVPHSLHSIVLSLLHGDRLAGHFSSDKTFQRSIPLCYWPYIRRDIDMHCRTCCVCESRRNPIPRTRAPMTICTSYHPFQRVFADITELPPTTKDNRYVLVIMDQFKKYVNLYPLHDQTAQSVAKCIFDHYISEHGIPETIHTDQGRQFGSSLIHELCQLLGIKKTRTSPYHPQSDGQVERFNRSLKDQLCKYLSTSTTSEWDDVLRQVELAYNSTVHSSTGYSPFYLAKGREPRLPAHILLGSPSPQQYASPQSYATSIKSCLTAAFAHVKANQDLASASQKHGYDSREKFRPFQPGQLVWRDDPAKSRVKLAPRWKGPYKVLSFHPFDEDTPVTYTIVDIHDPKSKLTDPLQQVKTIHLSYRPEPWFTATAAAPDQQSLPIAHL